MTAQEKERLQKAVRETAARIERYKAAKLNEQDTKAALIEPVLQALGWDTSDPEQVRREFKTNPKDNPVDYALLLMRQPRLVVEAKGLLESMSDHKWVGQTIGYAAVGGATWCVLTNGDDWVIYNATAPVAAAEKMLCRVRLSADSVGDVSQALALISRGNLGENKIELIWKAQHIDRKVRAVIESAFATQDRRIIEIVRETEAGLSAKDVTESLRRLAVRVDQPPLPFPVGRQPRVAASPKQNQTTPGVVHITEPKPRAKPIRQTADGPRVGLSDLIAAGLIKPPSRLFCRYKKTMLEAVVLPTGEVEFGKVAYPSPSTAASHARGTITGRPMATNGWDFWRLTVGGRKVRLEDVRAEYVRSKRSPDTA